MISDKGKSNADESSSSKSNSVLGRREEGSSPSHSHMNNNLKEQQRLMMLRSQGTPRAPAVNEHVDHINNLEEEQRLMRLPYHRMIQRMPHTDPSSSSEVPVYPPGSRFLPTHLGCVRVHLRSKVEKNKSGFITTLDLYKDDPWMLDHVQNDLFPREEWYYFTPRNKRGASSCIRAVRGSGGGGTWKTITKKESIIDKNNKVEGYKQNLVYNKTDVNGDMKPTGWNMKEYCLYKENQDDLVLCHLKGNLNKKGFAEEEVKEKKNILPNQVQDHEEEEEAAGANGVEMKTTLQEDHGEATQQLQQEQDAMAHVLPPHEGQDLGFETTQNNNDNNFMKPMLQEDHGEHPTPQQQQKQDAPVLPLPSHHEGQDPWFDTTLEEDLKYHWDDPNLWFSADELLGDIREDDLNEGYLQQQPGSQAPDALGGSAD